MQLRFLFIKIFTFPPFWSRSLSETVPDQSQVFCFQGHFVSKCQMDLDVVPLVKRKVNRLETYWGHIQVTKWGRSENSEICFNLESIYYQSHRYWQSSETLCHHEKFGNKLPAAWSFCIGKAVSSDIICFNSGKCLSGNHQMMCGCTKSYVLSLGVSHESRCHCIRGWLSKG